MPGWFDSIAYTKLKGSKYTKHTEVLKRGKHFYEHGGKNITAKFQSIVFVLDNFKTTPTTYKGICSGMML